MRLRSSADDIYREDDVLAAAEQSDEKQAQLGSMCLTLGLLGREEIEEIFAHCRTNGMGFADAALALGKLEAETVKQLIVRRRQFPVLLKGDQRIDPEVTAAFDPYDPYVTDIRAVRGEIASRFAEDDPDSQRAVAIIGADPEVDVAVAGANLGVTTAQLGWSTLLIDGDLETPRLHDLFRVPNDRGLSDLIFEANRTGLPVATAVDRLDILPTGPAAPNGYEALVKTPLLEIADQHRFGHRLIIATLSRLDRDHAAGLDRVFAGFDGVVIAVRRHGTSLRPLQRLVADLERRGVPVLGTVITE